MKIIAVLLAIMVAALAWWWPAPGNEAKPFPGDRRVAELVSHLTGGGDLPRFEGAPATARPLPPLDLPPHPLQDNRGYAGAHGDSYNSGVIAAAGPLGNNLQVSSRIAGRLQASCSTQHFDRAGRVITACVGPVGKSKLLLLDPRDLAVLAEHDLPAMSGWYIRMDQAGRVYVPAGDLSIQVFAVAEEGGAPAWRLVARHDLSAAVPEDRRGNFSFPLDLVADWEGNWWFTVLNPAVVGYITPGGEVRFELFDNERIENGLAASPVGVFVATNKGLYAMRAGDTGVAVHLSIPYESGAAAHSLSSGSGTTPVIFGDGNLIAFGDNADPRPNVLVYRIDDVADDERLVCKLPVFREHRTVLENSFIGYRNSLVIENNRGFAVFGDSADGEPGFARIDVRPDLSGCDLVWENYAVRAGSGAKLSLGSGLIYVHELLQDTGWVNAWYVTALDFRTGERVWRRYAGSGKQWDNAMLTLSVGPDGLLTSGMLLGVLGARDAPGETPP